MKTTIIYFILLFIPCSALMAQRKVGANDSIQGSKLPYKFIKNLNGKDNQSFPVNQNNLPTVIIFWAKYCSPCIQAFPKYEKLYKKFHDKANIILVAPDDAEHREIFKMYSKKMKINISSGFDKDIMDRRSYPALPYCIFVDKSGVVVRTSASVFEEDVQHLVDETLQPFNWAESFASEGTYGYNRDSLFLLNNNGGNESAEIIYRSVFCEWKSGMPSALPFRIYQPNLISESRVEALKASMDVLYKTAYLGSAVERVENSAFNIEWAAPDSIVAKYKDKFFCYSLKVPPSRYNKDALMNIMQRDLENIFGLQGKIIEKEVHCWELREIDSKSRERILSKGGEFLYEWNPLNVNLINVPFAEFLGALNGLLFKYQPLVVNKTSFKPEDHIDLKFEGLILDGNEVNLLLQQRGLILVPGKMNLKVLTIQEIK